MDDFTRYRNFNLDTDVHKLDIPSELPRRPAKFNNQGKAIRIMLNTFNVDKFPSQFVYQYDVSIYFSPYASYCLSVQVSWGQGTDETKRVLLRKIWNSKAVKEALGEPANLWVYDGNKLAW